MLETEKHTFLWDFDIQTDSLILARGPRQVVITPPHKKQKQKKLQSFCRLDSPQSRNENFVFNGISILVEYLIPKPFSLKNRSGSIYTIAGRIRSSYFSQGICLKVNVIARLELELTYYDSAVQHFNDYTTRTPREWKRKDW